MLLVNRTRLGAMLFLTAELPLAGRGSLDLTRALISSVQAKEYSERIAQIIK